MTAVMELPRVSGRHRNSALAKARTVGALELAAQGHTYAVIAAQLGYANRGTVHRMVHKELEARTVASIDQYRDVELARLDALVRVLWDKAMAGDAAAANALLRVSDQRCRLLGLYGRPGTSAAAPTGSADMSGKTVVLLPHER